MVKKIVDAWRMFWHEKSFKKAVKHANHVRNTRGLKCYVLYWETGYKAVSKQHVKHLLSIKYFKPGTSLKDIEQRAAYTTH